VIKGLLVDNNIVGQVRYLIRLLSKDEGWREIWNSLGIRQMTLLECGLANSSPDSEIWPYCQREQLILVTANRNSAGPNSLGATLATQNTPTSLPVFTLANVDRIGVSPSYAMRVAVAMLEGLIDVGKLLGTGRVYVP
jgi:hypothetical protein